MKKFFIGAGIVIVFLLAWAGIFYWKNLRGIGPAIGKPSADIAEVIEKEAPRPNAPEQGSVRDMPRSEEKGNPSTSLGDKIQDSRDTISVNTTEMPLTLPSGFSISIFAKGLGKPRVIIDDPAGGLLVSIPSQGRVVSLPDDNRDGVADRIVTVVEGLNRPHGMVAHCGTGCTLVIAESHRVARYQYDRTARKATFETKLFDLPDGGNHFTRTLLLYDERLLVSVGSSCNVCNEKDRRRAAVHITNIAGTAIEPFAIGLRNAVFMAVHLWTGNVWVTEMGRDLLGDDLPPDEINVLGLSKSREPRDYGWPYCYGKRVHDDNFDPRKTRGCDGTESSTIDLPAHSAPLGLAFIPDTDAWPKELWYDLLIAYHGSWNRSEPTGYKIVRYPLDRDGNVESGPVDFISGWLEKDGTALGRPVDLLVEPNGGLYISDDKAGVIYRVTRQ